jgi:hypothetical protein
MLRLCRFSERRVVFIEVDAVGKMRSDSRRGVILLVSGRCFYVIGFGGRCEVLCGGMFQGSGRSAASKNFTLFQVCQVGRPHLCSIIMITDVDVNAIVLRS